MRILFTFMGGRGHFEPLVPLAREALRAGHEVAFGCGARMAAVVEAAGFAAFSMEERAGPEPQRSALRPLDAEREEREFRERFARRAALDRAPRALALCASWRPDVIVCDETDFGAIVAAERLELAHASVLVFAAGPFARDELLIEILADLRAAQGLARDGARAMLDRHLVLSPFAPGLRDPAQPLPGTAHEFCAARPLAPGPGGSEPAWSKVLPGAPRIYFTLGTVFNMESGDLLERVLAALGSLPVNAIATVGAGIDPSRLGSQPASVRVERHVEQATLLPHCDLVVSHAGSGSVQGALVHGLPSVLIPLGADQPANAARCRDLRVARVLDAASLTPQIAAREVRDALADDRLRRAAERFRDAARHQPGPAHALQHIERLARRATSGPPGPRRSPGA